MRTYATYPPIGTVFNRLNVTWGRWKKVPGGYELLSHYPLSDYRSTKDLFNCKEEANLILEKKPGIKGKIRHLANNQHDNTEVIRGIFGRLIYKILSDIVEGQCSFIFPKNRNLKFGIKTVEGQALVDRLQTSEKANEDILNNIDFIATGNKYFMLSVDQNYFKRNKYYIMLPNSLKEKLFKTANEGKRFSKIPRFYDYYVDWLAEEYDFLTRQTLNRIVLLGLQRMRSYMKFGDSINITLFNKEKILIYRRFTPKKFVKHAKKQKERYKKYIEENGSISKHVYQIKL